MSVQSNELQFISVDREISFGAEKRSGYQRAPQRKKATIRAQRRRKRQRRRILCGIMCVCAVVLLLACYKTNWFTEFAVFAGNDAQIERLKEEMSDSKEKEEYPDELAELLDQNEETYEFVKDYPNRDAYIGEKIDLSKDYKAGSVPLLMQWDKRWGYDLYGNSMIGIAGCGPTCMTMAYLYHKGDLEMNPRKMAEFAQDNGYHSEEGTSWEFWTKGALDLGLYGEVVSLSEVAMKAVLDAGGLLICSMSPGDFTTGGHYILLRGYDENGFFVNDPNRESTSQKQWDYNTLSSQIKNLWGIYDLQ